MTDVSRPNILWITTHDINPDLGCYAGVWPGAEYATTPELDRLAAEGVRFDNAFATTPVCAPSRAAILMGTYPTASGALHMRSRHVPPPDVRCFPELLRAAGYYCTNNAFSDFQLQPPVTVWDEHGPQAHWRNRPDPAQPFFAVFHGMITHESQVHADDEQYRRNTARLADSERHDPAAAPLPPYYPDTPVFRQAWARYSDNITALDYQVGDLLRQLEEDGLAGSTLVVFWGDHGRGMPRAKRWAYESGLRVPLIARWPGRIPAGSSRAELVMLMDLAATMLSVAGVAVPASMHARPLFDAAGRMQPARAVVFGHRDRMDEQLDTVRTARDARFRYLRNFTPDRSGMQHHEYAEQMSTWRELRRLCFEEATIHGRGEDPHLLTPLQRSLMAPGRPPEELYDLQADPHETLNLAGDPAFAADLARLRVALEEWQREYGDLGMIPEAQLTARWRVGGLLPTTAPAEARLEGGLLTLRCATEGTSIGWTADPPGPPAERPAFMQNMGDPDLGGRRWAVYTGPFAPPRGPIWVRAQRLGWGASEDLAVEVR